MLEAIKMMKSTLGTDHPDVYVTRKLVPLANFMSYMYAAPD